MKQLPFFASLSLIWMMSSCTHKQEAQLIIKNAKIYTVDRNFTVVPGAAIIDGRFVDTGTDAKIMSKYTSKTILDLKGKYVYPGWMDPHCHFYGYGLELNQVDLTGSRSFDEVINRVKAHDSLSTSEWISGWGWDQNLWKSKSFPTNEKLNAAFPTTPVLLRRIDGHAAIANAEALRQAGITTSTKIKGGKIGVQNGKLTGLLIDKAADLVIESMPKPTVAEQSEALLKAQQNCFAVGLTSVGDAGLDKPVIELMDSLQKQNKLFMRIYAMINPTIENIEHFLKKGKYITPFLNVQSMKLYADGALGSRGAKLLAPYSDDPENTGMIVENPDSLRALCQLGYNYNYQVNTHCIGDSANRLMLTIYGNILKEKNDRRWRIEHAQVVDPGDFKLFGKYSIIPSIQTTHCTSDMYWAEDRLGPIRIKGAYAWQDLLKENGRLANGSDFPIESINPLYGFYAAVTRQDQNGFPEKGFYPRQKLSRMQALKAMTIWAAKAQFEETEKGSIEPGKVADFVITSQDIMSVNENEIFKVQVEQTWINGKKVFDKNTLPENQK